MSAHTIVLITGATSGIGRNTSLHLARNGYRVFATGRNRDALAALRAEAEGTALDTLELDVTDPESIAAARNEVMQSTDGHGVDVLVNNAGYGTVGPAEMCTDEDLRRQYDVNVFGLMAVTRAFLPPMRMRRSGRVINVSSIAGRVTFPFFGVYNSTKYAVESLTDALRMELRPFGIRFVLIEPGAIHTGFADRSMSELSRYQATDSPWAPVIDKADELRATFEKTAVGPEVVSRAIERAIRQRRPRARMMVPWTARLVIPLLRVLPTRLTDWIMRRVSRLTPAHLGLTARSRRPLSDGVR